MKHLDVKREAQEIEEEEEAGKRAHFARAVRR
jgi:hypothetical protein